jgi:hypothetical protein
MTWRDDMENAPRDGTEFLVTWLPHCFEATSGMRIAYFRPNGRMIDAGDDEPWNFDALPNRWQPLPTPPTTDKPEQEG